MEQGRYLGLEGTGGVDGFLTVQEHGRRKRFLIITTGGHGVGLLGKLGVRRRG